MSNSIEGYSMTTVPFESIRAEIVVSCLQVMSQTYVDFEEMIKQRLTEEIVKKLMNSKFLMFTKQSNPTTDDIIYRVRCCISDKDSIKMFLKNGVI